MTRQNPDPIVRRSMAITGRRRRRGGIVVVCTPDEVSAPSVLEIPGWMFDDAVYCRFR